MRRLGAVVVVFVVGGCSAIFDMDAYEPRARNDGGAASSSSGGSSGNVSDAATSGGDGSGGTDASTGGIDAAPDASTGGECTDESEPNDDEGAANPLVMGDNCGMIGSASDEDYFAFTTSTNGTIGILIPASVKFEMFKNGATSPSAVYQGGGGVTPTSPGSYVVRMRLNGAGPLPAYKLRRQ